MRLLISIAALSLTAVVGCDGDGTQAGLRPTPRPSPAPVETVSCPNQSGAPLEDGSLEGDVDGDGAEDTVRLAVDQAGPSGCRAFVVVDTGDGELVGAIVDENISFDLGLPSLNGLAEIDAEPGSEVVVDVTAGASTSFAAVFTASDSGVERLRFADDALPYGDLFPYGGSVGHLESSDCAPGGGVLVSVATPDGKRYRLERRFFSVQGTDLVLEEIERVLTGLRDLQDFPEYAGPPFASCD